MFPFAKRNFISVFFKRNKLFIETRAFHYKFIIFYIHTPQHRVIPAKYKNAAFIYI